MVNGRAAAIGELIDPARDDVTVDGRRIAASEARTTILLNKPAGYLVSRRDPHHSRTVYELLPADLRHLVPVGRLDLNSEGALLMTDDGRLAELLTHPRYRVPKVYRAVVAGRPGVEAVERLRGGVTIDGVPTGCAEVRLVRQEAGEAELELVLREGRKRQVRRMCDAVGHPVRRVRRIAFARVPLEDLPAGRWRRLDEAEVAALRALGEPSDDRRD